MRAAAGCRFFCCGAGGLCFDSRRFLLLVLFLFASPLSFFFFLLVVVSATAAGVACATSVAVAVAAVALAFAVTTAVACATIDQVDDVASVDAGTWVKLCHLNVLRLERLALRPVRLKQSRIVFDEAQLPQKRGALFQKALLKPFKLAHKR